MMILWIDCRQLQIHVSVRMQNIKFWKKTAFLDHEVIKRFNWHAGPKHDELNNGLLFFTSAGPEQVKVDKIVNKLTNITDHVHFKSTDIETDGDGGYF